MGYLATNIARIPSQGFDYFLFLLEDNWNDDLRREFSDNFENLAREVGTKTLVVRGADREGFTSQILDKYDIHVHTVLPALAITDTAPAIIGQYPERLVKPKLIVIPLGARDIKRGAITNILKKVATTLRDNEAIDSLESLDKSRILRTWGWIRYIELKPNYYGFGIDINRIIDDTLFGS